MITLPFPAIVTEVLAFGSECYEIKPERELSKKEIEYIKKELGGYFIVSWLVNKKYAESKGKR